MHGSQHTYHQLHSSRLSNARATTTQHKHSTELALCPRCHPALASEGTLVGPGMDTHGTPVPRKAVGGSTAHTSTWHRTTQQTRMSPKQIHEVTNTDSVICAHGSGVCYGYTADDNIADRRSVLWRLHHVRLDVGLAVVVAACCKVPEHGLDDNEVANVSQEQGHRER